MDPFLVVYAALVVLCIVVASTGLAGSVSVMGSVLAAATGGALLGWELRRPR